MEARVEFVIEYTDEAGETKSVTVTEAIRSLKRRNAMAETAEQNAKEADKISKIYQDAEKAIVDDESKSTEEKEQLLAANKIQYAHAISQLMSKVERSTLLAAIDERQLDTKTKELLFSDIDSHFWQNCDFDKVREATKFFRRGV